MPGQCRAEHFTPEKTAMSQSVNPFDFNPFFSGMDFFTGKTANAWPLPSVNPQELDKRISELKTVLFWLEQNTAAVRAGIQALQVQKMTLTALQSMNLSAAEMMRAFAMPAAAASAPATGGGAAPNAFNTAPNTASQTAPKTAPDTAPEAAPDKAASAAPDPLQWWNALTQQFQSIAAATAASAMPAAAGWAKAAPAGAAPDSHDCQSGAHEAGQPARHADAQPARAAKKPSADPAADGAARKHKAAKGAS